ncbi:hypothetical protein FRB98_002554 [Tulasnella sp. 332]|nr:hypothetical protein FRB98_002554 [Tulasnella sp. 332]
MAGQRTYLATYPFWVPLMLNLWNIARWMDWNYSFKLCCIWWGLWWLNMLLPGSLWCLVYQLIKHRVLPYPTIKQLEERRQRALEAEKIIGMAISGDGSKQDNDEAPKWKSAMVMTSLGLTMGISANTLIASNTSDPVKKKVKDGLRVAAGAMTGHWGKKGKEGVDGETKMDYVHEDEELVDKTRRRQANDWRRLGLIGLEELADLHERMRNMMLWRKPEATRMYTIVIAVLAFIVMVTPVQYLAKGTYAGLGFVYWFPIPTLCAMSRKQRALLPSPFFDIPTDAEYAMEIIARRLKLGHSITPDKKMNHNRDYIRGSTSNVDVSSTLSPTRSRDTASVLSAVVGAGVGIGSPIGGSAMLLGPTSMNGDTASIRSGMTNTTDRSVDGAQKPSSTYFNISANRGQDPISGPDVTNVSPTMQSSMPHKVGGRLQIPGSLLPIQAQTFSAHYNHLPGILTITQAHIEYTPLSFFNKLRKNSDDLKISISLDCIRGVKKASSRSKSLVIRYIEPVAVAVGENATNDHADEYHKVDDPEGDRDAIVMTEREVTFKWVGHRDEVFARLVASKQNSWVPV